MPLPAWKHPSDDRGERHATILAACGTDRTPGRVPGEADRVGCGRGAQTPLGPHWRVTLAWLAILAAGLAMPLTGQRTWPIAGYEVFGEYVVSFLALGAAGFAVWAFGLRSDLEWLAARCTVLLALLTPATAALSDAWFWPAEFLMHFALTAQLAAWLREAIRLRGSEAWPVLVMFAGLAVECANLIWKMYAEWYNAREADAACDAVLWLTCAAGPWSALILPLTMTVAMAPWLFGVAPPWQRGGR